MKIVVTGARGLVGKRLTALLQEGHDVWAIARQPIEAPTHPRLHWIAADLATNDLARDLPPAADVVVHLAQSPHHRDFPAQALDIFRVNVGSTVRLLDWSRSAGVRQFILASSGAVGSGGPPSYYVASKHSAEQLASSYAGVFGVLVIRFFFVYGHEQTPTMLVPRLIETIRSGGEVTVAGGEGPRLNPVHVDDAALALTRAIDGGSTGLVNIAGPEVLTIKSMSEVIAERLGLTPRFTGEASPRAQDLVGDISRMTELWGAPALSFRAGVDRMITAMEGNRAR